MERELFDTGRTSPEAVAAWGVAELRKAIERERRRCESLCLRPDKRADAYLHRAANNGRCEALAWVLEQMS